MTREFLFLTLKPLLILRISFIPITKISSVQRNAYMYIGVGDRNIYTDVQFLLFQASAIKFRDLATF